MKKILSFLLCSVFMFSILSVTANAQEPTGQKDIVAILQLDGKTYYLDQDELTEFKQQNKVTNSFSELNSIDSSSSTEVTPKNAGSWWIITNKKFGTPYLNSSKKAKVTPSVKGPATITKGSSVTFSFTSNISLSISDKTTIGGTWSASSNASFSVSFKVPSNKTGYVQFTPYYRTVTADKLHYFDATLLKTEKLNIKQPVKVGSFADGLYELKLQ